MSCPEPQQSPELTAPGPTAPGPTAPGHTAPHGGLWPNLSVLDWGRCPPPRPSWGGHGHSSPASPSAGSASKIKPQAAERGAGGAPSSASTPGTPEVPSPGVGAGRALEQPALLNQQRRGRRSDGKRARRRGGKNNTGSAGIVRGNLLSCCLQTPGLPGLPAGSPFPSTGRAGTTPGVPQFPSRRDSLASRSCS